MMNFEIFSLVTLSSIAPKVIQDPRYASEENFIGRIIKLYKKGQEILCTKPAAEALKQVSDFLSTQAQPYRLVVYDAYRPQESVDDFYAWSQNTNEAKKPQYYPDLEKNVLFSSGYISKNSTHTFGDTFDLTIIKSDEKPHPVKEIPQTFKSGYMLKYLDDGTLNMGTHFDFFGEASHHDSPLVDTEHLENREILRKAMKNFGFTEYKNEWWHYRFQKQ